MNTRPLLVNQKGAAEMLGISVDLFNRLTGTDLRLMPAVIPKTKGAKRWLVSDLENYVNSLKYPNRTSVEVGGMWSDESAP